jgi:hypothetical protein
LKYMNSCNVLPPALEKVPPFPAVAAKLLGIGLEKTKQITTTMAAFTYLRRAMTADLLRCWHHSVATAVLSEVIATSCGAFENLAFVAGIMHDLGRLGLLAAYPDDYANLIRKCREEPCGHAGCRRAKVWDKSRRSRPAVGRSMGLAGGVSCHQWKAS